MSNLVEHVEFCDRAWFILQEDPTMNEDWQLKQLLTLQEIGESPRFRPFLNMDALKAEIQSRQQAWHAKAAAMAEAIPNAS